MPTVGQIYGVLKLKGGNQFVKDFKSVSQRFKANVKENRMEFAKLGMELTAIVYGAKKLVDTFAEVDRGVREITTLLGNVTKRQFKELKESLEETAIKFGQVFGAMAKAQYDIISAGFTKVADSVKVLAVAAKLAVAGVSDVSKTALAVTKVLNAMGLGVRHATSVADMLFTTVAKGQTTIDELVSQIGQLTPTARAAKLGLDGLGAVLAVTTAGGLDTASASVALRGALDAIVAPMGGYKKIMKDAGIGTYSFKDGTMDLVKTFKQFEGMDLDIIKKFIPEDRAANAVMIMSNNIDKLSEALDAMAVKAGMNEEAFNKMSKGISFRLDQAKARFSKTFATLGQALYPLYDLGLTFLEILTKMPASIQAIITNIVAITSVILILRKALLFLSISMGPAGWLIAGLTLAASAFILFKNKTNDATKELSAFREEVNNLETEMLENKMINLKLRVQELLGEYKKESWKDSGFLTAFKTQIAMMSGDMSIMESKRYKIIKELKDIEARYQILEGLQAKRRKGESGLDGGDDVDLEKEYLQKLQDLQYEHGEITMAQYVAHLQKRRDAFEEHTTEYLNLHYKIKDIEKEAADKSATDIEKAEEKKGIALKDSKDNQLAFLEAQQDIEYNYGKTSFDDYMAILQERLNYTEKFSAEYISIWARMSGMIADNQKRQLDKMKQHWLGYVNIMRSVGQSIGDIITDKMVAGADKFKEMGKVVLLAIVDILEKKLLAAKISALIEGIINWASFAKNMPQIIAAEMGLAALRGVITGMAEGGIVTKPTLALIGERSSGGRYVPEVVAPQDKFEDFARQLTAQTAGYGGGRQDINLTQNFNTPLQDKRMANKMTEEVLKPEMRRTMKRQGRYVNQNPFKS